MSTDGPAKPVEQEIPQTPDDSFPQSVDGPGHSTMDDIDAADFSRADTEGEHAYGGVSDGLAEPADGDRGTDKPATGADANGVPEESGALGDSGPSGHDKTMNATAEDIDAIGVTDHLTHDGEAGDWPLTSEDSPSASSADGTIIGAGLGDSGSPGKPSAEFTDAGERPSPPTKTGTNKELAALEKGPEATRCEAGGDVTDRPTAELNDSNEGTEEPADPPEPSEGERDDGSADMARETEEQAKHHDEEPAGRVESFTSTLSTLDSALTETHDPSQETSALGSAEETKSALPSDAARPADEGEPNSVSDLFEVTEPEEPKDVGAPVETADSDAARLRSDSSDTLEHRDGDEASPTEASILAAGSEGVPAPRAASKDGTPTGAPDSGTGSTSSYAHPETGGQTPETEESSEVEERKYPTKEQEVADHADISTGPDTYHCEHGNENWGIRKGVVPVYEEIRATELEDIASVADNIKLDPSIVRQAKENLFLDKRSVEAGPAEVLEKKLLEASIPYSSTEPEYWDPERLTAPKTFGTHGIAHRAVLKGEENPEGHGEPVSSGPEPAVGHDAADMATRRDFNARIAPESTIPAPPKESGDIVLDTGDPVYFRNGRTAIGYDKNTGANFDNVQPLDGRHDVVVHGNNQGFFEPGRVNEAGVDFTAGDTHPTHIADATRANPSYDGGPVRLVSCHTGTIAEGALGIPAAQAIANALGVPVMAPTNKVGVSSRLGPAQTPTIYGGGYWRTFLPIVQ
ncbi:hypothetical protein ACWGK6_36615 [Streptomyces violaceusniger]